MTEGDKKLIFPEAHSSIDGILEYLADNPKETLTEYGHAVGMIAAVAYANCESCDVVEQKAKLKQAALHYVEKFGPKIIEFLKPELREALEIDISNI